MTISERSSTTRNYHLQRWTPALLDPAFVTIRALKGVVSCEPIDDHVIEIVIAPWISWGSVSADILAALAPFGEHLAPGSNTTNTDTVAPKLKGTATSYGFRLSDSKAFDWERILREAPPEAIALVVSADGPDTCAALALRKTFIAQFDRNDDLQVAGIPLHSRWGGPSIVGAAPHNKRLRLVNSYSEKPTIDEWHCVMIPKSAIPDALRDLAAARAVTYDRSITVKVIS